MKIIAFVLIMLSACGFGFELNKSQKRRMEQLYSLLRYTDYIYAELSARPCSMDELSAKAMSVSSGSIQPFLKELMQNFELLGSESFAQIWRRACGRLTYINDRQREIMAALGERLGNFELVLQLKAIQGCNEELKREYDKMKSEYPNNSKLCIALPCTVACMILLVLV